MNLIKKSVKDREECGACNPSMKIVGKFKLKSIKDAKKKPKLGTGKRFSNLEHKIEKGGKSEKQAGAIAAAIGRKKYGKKKFQAMAAA